MMGRQGEAMARRLRRLARALTDDVDSADALVMETLSAAEERHCGLIDLLTILIGRRRLASGLTRRKGRAGGHSPDIVRAFEALPLQDREVLALVVVEQLAYEEAARVLDITQEALAARLSQARTAFARLADGERHVVLRLVK
jgi:DNA-directed RNA polymerase specialized sigma24 family protein